MTQLPPPVDAFGDYAREPELQREPIRLDRLVKEVVTLYQQADSGIRFQLDLVPGPDGFLADSGRIRQLLHNLIRNADESQPEKAVNLQIRTALSGAGTRPGLVLELLDDGPGFPATVLDNPFEPYVTNKSKGSGLGLAICRKIVSEHDGRIAVENRAGGGARVEVFFPLSVSLGRPAASE